MGADGNGTGAVAVPLAWQPALTAMEVRMEAADEAAGRHWSGPDGCWCDEFHHQTDAVPLVLVAPPWDKSRRAAVTGSAVAS